MGDTNKKPRTDVKLVDQKPVLLTKPTPHTSVRLFTFHTSVHVCCCIFQDNPVDQATSSSSEEQVVRISLPPISLR